jgi:hypothetical protein
METVANILIQNNRNNDQQTDEKMETVSTSLIKNNGNSNQLSDPKREQLLVSVPTIFDQAIGYSSGDFGSGCW